jgi:hypothetical protein
MSPIYPCKTLLSRCSFESQLPNSCVVSCDDRFKLHTVEQRLGVAWIFIVRPSFYFPQKWNKPSAVSGWHDDFSTGKLMMEAISCLYYIIIYYIYILHEGVRKTFQFQFSTFVSHTSLLFGKYFCQSSLLVSFVIAFRVYHVLRVQACRQITELFMKKWEEQKSRKLRPQSLTSCWPRPRLATLTGSAWHNVRNPRAEVRLLWEASSGTGSLCPDQSAPDLGRCLAYANTGVPVVSKCSVHVQVETGSKGKQGQDDREKHKENHRKNKASTTQ